MKTIQTVAILMAFSIVSKSSLAKPTDPLAIKVFEKDGNTWSVKAAKTATGYKLTYKGFLYAGCSGMCMLQGYEVELDNTCRLTSIAGDAAPEPIMKSPVTGYSVPEKSTMGSRLQRLRILPGGRAKLDLIQKAAAAGTLKEPELKKLGILDVKNLFDADKNPNWDAFDAASAVKNPAIENDGLDQYRLVESDYHHYDLAPEEVARLRDYANDPAALKRYYELLEGTAQDHSYAARMSQAASEDAKGMFRGAGNSVATFLVHMSMVRQELARQGIKACGDYPVYNSKRDPGKWMPAQPADTHAR